MYEFDHSTPVTVSLRAHSGTVELIAEDRLTIQVEIEPISDNETSQEAARKTLVTLEDGTLSIHTPGSDSWSWRRHPRLRITARVPLGSSLTGRSASAPVHAAGTWSAIRIDAASADIEIAEATGNVALDSASGDITIEKVGGALKATSASGGLRLGDVTGDVAARSASGTVRLRSSLGSVQASSASGDIEIGELRAGQASLKTASGDVEVGVTPGTGVWLDLNTASGRSVSDLTAQGPVPTEPATLELRVRTASGDIRVHRALTGGLAA